MNRLNDEIFCIRCCVEHLKKVENNIETEISELMDVDYMYGCDSRQFDRLDSLETQLQAVEEKKLKFQELLEEKVEQTYNSKGIAGI